MILRDFTFALSAVLALGSFACKGNAEESSSPTPVANPSGVVDAQPSALALDLGAFEQLLFDGTTNTEGVVVQHEGKLVYEKYAAGFDATKRHLSYSVSKSLGSALLGIAVADGLVKVDDSVCTYLPEIIGSDPALCETTLGSLAQMTSGLKFDENYDNPVTSNVLPMLYGDETDMGEYVARRGRANPVGVKWSYSSAVSYTHLRSSSVIPPASRRCSLSRPRPPSRRRQATIR